MKKDQVYFSKILHPDKQKTGYFGKYQYIFKRNDMKISMITIKYNNLLPVYEIYCLRGNIFEDVERYEKKEEALAQIKKYLTIK